jgi:hypothetical protein
MKIFDAIKGIDARAFFIIIRIGATGYQIPTLTKQLHAIRLHIEVVFLVLPITVIGHV